MMLPLANMFGIENWGLILIAGLLLFGRRLPEVGRSVGRSIVEFKKGLNGIEDEIDTASKNKTETSHSAPLDRQLTGERAAVLPGHKFDPFTGEPIRQEAVTESRPRFDPYTGKPLTEMPVEQASDRLGV